MRIEDEVWQGSCGKGWRGAKGAGSAAAGAANEAVDLATLHPIDAGAAVGTGAVKAGEGIGHAMRKILWPNHAGGR